MKGPNPHTIAQLKDAVRDGTRAVKNAIEDLCLIPGAGSFEIACHHHLMQYIPEVKGKAKLGGKHLVQPIARDSQSCSAENSWFLL